MDVQPWIMTVAKVTLILALLGIALLVLRLLNRWLARLIARLQLVDQEREQQLETLLGAGSWAVAVLLVTVAVITVLGNFIDITPLLASVGVAGLALSLGAQTLIKDLVAGVIILLEHQYSIGDAIRVNGIEGQVERFTLRATFVRSVDGFLHVIPNGEARIVANATKDWSCALVELGVAYEEDPERVLRVLEETAATFAREAPCKDDLIEAPQVEGPQSLGNWAMTMRVAVKTRTGRHIEVARQLRLQLLAACEEAGIELPYPRQEVVVRSRSGE